MVPIYEQGNGRGIGHGIESFLCRFEDITLNYMEREKVTSLALIFYDYHDSDFKKILKSEGVFTKLDRLSNEKLNIFYLHSGDDKLLRTFNKSLLELLGIKSKIETPCVVFFKATKKGFKDIHIANLYSPDLTYGFHELYETIEFYINDDTSKLSNKYITWIKGSLGFVSKEAVKEIVKDLVKTDPLK